MSPLATKLKTSRAAQKALERLSPFELKDNLIALARAHSTASASALLNAGRGNPNWIAVRPREAFFLLGTFALAEARRDRDEEGLVAGVPRMAGIARRLAAFLDANAATPGAAFLRSAVDHGVARCGFDADAWVHELADAVLGDHYPEPVRMLAHAERVVRDYLAKEMCDGRPPPGTLDLFAVEGGTAAVCYVLDSLFANGLLKRGDRIALLVPTFTPYIDIPALDTYALNVVRIAATPQFANGTRGAWRFPREELARLADRRVKLAFLVNPNNPTSVALGPDETRQIVGIVRRRNPGLMLVTDDVYGTFVPHFRSLLSELPRSTICIYSFSKAFGATGWRLGVIAIHERNVFDRRLARLPLSRKRALRRRYARLCLHPEKLRFIDRMVADSRSVALHHTAGLSGPQQVMMTLLALSNLTDPDDTYKQLTMAIVRRRRDQLYRGFGLPPPAEVPTRAWYYVDIDFMAWAHDKFGAEFCAWMRRHYEPVDFLFRLAEKSGVVLLDGGGFGGSPWSLRISLANLKDDDYRSIGRHMRHAADVYFEAWQAGTTVAPHPATVRTRTRR